MVEKVGRRYAEAIYEIAQEENKVEAIGELLEEFSELYDNNNEFREFFGHPLVEKKDKLTMIERIIDGEENSNNEIEKNIILYIADRGRLSNINEILEEYKSIYYKENNIIDVKAIFATELSEEQKNSLIAKLENSTKKKVNLELKIDASLIGGGIVKIGDRVIDGSVKSQLENMAKSR